MFGKLAATILAVFALLCMASVSLAAKTYQVTGPVLELTDKTIVVEKDKEKWEVDRAAGEKVTGGELKVGEKVTIHYVMTAKTIEVKGEKPAAEKEAKAAPAKEAKPAAAKEVKPTATPAKKN
jgi:hypothetical protein